MFGEKILEKPEKVDKLFKMLNRPYLTFHRMLFMIEKEIGLWPVLQNFLRS
jgi:hypothetical protein